MHHPINDSKPMALAKPSASFNLISLLAILACVVFVRLSRDARADEKPVGCTGSALGIDLFTDVGDVHIGDTVRYSATVFNGLPGSTQIACDATEILAGIVTPDGKTNMITLRRTSLPNAENDFYLNVVSYIVRAQDVQTDGTVRATAFDNGNIHQNDTDSRGGGNQGVNTEVVLCLSTPQILVTAACGTSTVTAGGVVSYTGTVKNVGDIPLNNIVVISDRPVPNSPVITVATLAPGASANFIASCSVPLNACSVTTTITGTGKDSCSGNTATNAVLATCIVATTPQIAVTLHCLIRVAAPGGAIIYGGTVSNPGDVRLINIVVFDSHANPGAVFTLPSLAPGVSANFTGSGTAPVDACSVTSTVTATGTDACSSLVSNTASITCPLSTVASLVATQECPVNPAASGGVLTYTGTVRNTGNITLTNVAVLNNQSGSRVVFTTARLAPGEVANFTGNFNVSTNSVCAVTSTVTATANDKCMGMKVSALSTSTCPLLIAPQITVTLLCPATPVLPGAPVIFNGVVLNSGNITLTNIFISSDQSPGGPFLGPIDLAPGQSAPYNGSCTAPLNACSVSVKATGADNCSARSVTNTASCSIATVSRIAVTQNYSTGIVTPGSLLNYSGTVSNAGNVTLNDVVVLNDRTGPTPIFTTPILLPGESASFSGSYMAPRSCFAMGTSTARALSLCGVLVSNSVSTICPVLTAPQIQLSTICSAGGAVPGGLLTYGGTITNTGNSTVTNIIVVSDVPKPNTVIFVFTGALLPGSGTSFSTTYLVPVNACAVTANLVATARELCSGQSVSGAASAICPVNTTPGLAITQNCPLTLVTPNGSLTYSGSISNSGNITLTNLVVSNDQTGTAPILILAALLPGASASFTGTYTAPGSGSATSTSTVRATSVCGVAVTKSATSVCPILTASGIAVTKACPAVPVTPGGTLVFTGTVTNTGNVTLTNVFVVDDQPAANTPVIGPIILAPGAGVSFTGSYVVPANACSVTDTLTATGINSATGVAVTGVTSATCPVNTTPGIVIVENCPPGPVTLGSPVVFSGSVTNTGNITLTNVFVFSNQPSNHTPVLGPITLLPGASVPFTSSFIAAGGSNPTSISTIVTNASGSITTNQLTIILTNNAVTIITNAAAPSLVTIRSPLAARAGEVVSRFEVGDNLNGLTFYGSASLYGPTLFYSIRHNDLTDSIFTIIKTEVAPHTDPPRTEPKDPVGIRNYDSLAFAAPQITGASSVSFYTLRHDAAGASYFGYIIPGGVHPDLFTGGSIGNSFDSLTFAAPNAAAKGANLFYYLRHDLGGNSFFGTINPDATTSGAAATDLFNLGKKIDYMTFSPVDVGYGPSNQFYYLRYDSNGNTVFGTIDASAGYSGTPAGRAVDRFTLTGRFHELEFTDTDVGYGANLFYSISGGASFTTNTVTTLATNTVTTLVTNSVTTFTTNTVSTFTVTNTVMAIGIDTCQGRTIIAAANCSGAIAPTSFEQASLSTLVLQSNARPTVSANVSNGLVTVSWTAIAGTTYVLQFTSDLENEEWVTVPEEVMANGVIASKKDEIIPGSQRFYRVLVVGP